MIDLRQYSQYIRLKIFRYICHELWDSKEYQDYYSIVLMSLQFIIPLAVLIFTYAKIAVAVWGNKFNLT